MSAYQSSAQSQATSASLLDSYVMSAGDSGRASALGSMMVSINLAAGYYYGALGTTPALPVRVAVATAAPAAVAATAVASSPSFAG